MRNSARLGGVFICLIGFANLVFGGANDASALPRYSLPVGRELTYSSTSQQTNKDFSLTEKFTTLILVAGEGLGGSRHLIVRSDRTYGSLPDQVSVGWIDVYPDGREANPSSTLDLSEIPPLPLDASQLKQGWTIAESAGVSAENYSAVSSDKEFIIQSLETGLLPKLYGRTEKRVMHFDRSKGIVVAIDTTSSMDYELHSTEQAHLKLDSDQMIPPNEATQIGQEYAVLFKADEAHDALMDTMDREPEHAEKISADARAILVKAAASATRPQIKERFQELLKSHDESAEREIDDAKKIVAVLNQPAFAFQTIDLDLKSFNLADFRGKVVVLDFWFRGCGWCIRGMPQIKQIVNDFKDKPVVILGMNTDDAAADGRAVAQAMQLNYPTLIAHDLPDKFGVTGYPTLIVIDQRGIVRNFNVGYSPTLRVDIGKQIQSLLGNAQTAAVIH
jgi:thiol-disulfide isomerase/thioredoxin